MGHHVRSLGAALERMMRAAAVVGILAFFSFPVGPRAKEESDEAERVRAAAAVFGEIMAAGDQSIPRAILGKAEAIAIFPGTLRAGFIVGGMRGRGVISAKNAGAWSAPAFLTLTGGSVGLQIGGQSADLILVINDRRGVENLVSNQFKLGADAAVAAGPVGRDAQAATDLQLRAQILSYSRSRGLFAGVTVNGSTVRQDRDANERFYGQRLETKQIVFGSATVHRPEPVAFWLEGLDRYAR